MAWDWRERKLHRVDAHGTWTEADGGIFNVLARRPHAERCGRGLAQVKQWYFTGAAGLFVPWWKGKPVFPGSVRRPIRSLGRGAPDTVLLGHRSRGARAK